jgi:hypothetical protein
VCAGVSGFALRSKSDAPAASVAQSLLQQIPPNQTRLIPEAASYRLATANDFDSDAVAVLTNSGQPVGGTIQGAFASSGQSQAYVLMGKNQIWRVVILADGKLRCDAQYRSVAIALRVPREKLGSVIWSTPPPPDSQGDGLLIVRSSKDASSGIVLFLSGDQVSAAVPSDYRPLLLKTS